MGKKYQYITHYSIDRPLNYNAHCLNISVDFLIWYRFNRNFKILTESKLDESLEHFLERRHHKKKCGDTQTALSKHITEFFSGKEHQFSGVKIDIQVTVKGNVDLLRPLRTSSPVVKLENVQLKPETIQKGEENCKKSNDDEEIEVVPINKNIVEIELTSTEEEAVADGSITMGNWLPDIKSVTLKMEEVSEPVEQKTVEQDVKLKNLPDTAKDEQDGEDWIRVVSPQHFAVNSQEENITGKESYGPSVAISYNEVEIESSEIPHDAQAKEEIKYEVKDENSQVAPDGEDYNGKDVKFKENDHSLQVAPEGEESDAKEDIKYEVKNELEISQVAPDGDEYNGEEVKYEVKEELDSCQMMVDKRLNMTYITSKKKVKYEDGSSLNEALKLEENSAHEATKFVLKSPTFIAPTSTDYGTVSSTGSHEKSHSTFIDNSNRLIADSMKVNSVDNIMHTEVRQLIFGTFNEEANGAHKEQSFKESYNEAKGNLNETSSARVSCDKGITDGATGDDVNKTQAEVENSDEKVKNTTVKSLVPDYNSDQSSLFEKKSNMSTEDGDGNQDLNKDNADENVGGNLKSDVEINNAEQNGAEALQDSTPLPSEEHNVVSSNAAQPESRSDDDADNSTVNPSDQSYSGDDLSGDSLGFEKEDPINVNLDKTKCNTDGTENGNNLLGSNYSLLSIQTNQALDAATKLGLANCMVPKSRCSGCQHQHNQPRQDQNDTRQFVPIKTPQHVHDGLQCRFIQKREGYSGTLCSDQSESHRERKAQKRHSSRLGTKRRHRGRSIPDRNIRYNTSNLDKPPNTANVRAVC